MARKISFEPPTQKEQVDATLLSTAPVSGSRARPLLGLEHSIKQPAALGALSHTLEGMNEKAKRAAEIEQLLIQGQTIIELDPASVDNSFIADRMDATEEQNAEFREIIRQNGQNVPILVRPKPGQLDRFEVAFGHRRLRAARELGIKVRAVVRILTDEELVIAQGQENSGRTDLTFIERARFAARLEERKFSRDTIMAALNVDKAALSRLIAIATRVPSTVIDAIGPAPSYGRVRWQDLTELLEDTDNRKQANVFVSDPSFLGLESDKRFEALWTHLRTKTRRGRGEAWASDDGIQVARISRVGKRMTLTFDDRNTPQFGDFVQSKLQNLFDEYKASTERS